MTISHNMEDSLPNNTLRILGRFINGKLTEEAFFDALHESANYPAKDHPSILLAVAKKVFRRHPDTAISLIYTALAERELSEHPQKTIASAAKILSENGHSHYAETVFKGAIKLYPDNLRFFVQLSNLYLGQSRFQAAIDLLKPVLDSGRGSTFIAAALGKAYIQSEQPELAIQILKPLHVSGKGDYLTAFQLGNAYAITKNQKGFDDVKYEVRQGPMRDYLQAKLHYLNNDSAAALKVVRPHITNAANIAEVHGNILNIFLATVGDESPIFQHLKSSVDETIFVRLIERRDIWRANPLRMELANDPMHSSQMLWELGGVAASRKDATSAGLGMEARVSVKGSQGPTSKL